MLGFYCLKLELQGREERPVDSIYYFDCGGQCFTLHFRQGLQLETGFFLRCFSLVLTLFIKVAFHHIPVQHFFLLGGMLKVIDFYWDALSHPKRGLGIVKFSERSCRAQNAEIFVALDEIASP